MGMGIKWGISGSQESGECLTLTEKTTKQEVILMKISWWVKETVFETGRAGQLSPALPCLF